MTTPALSPGTGAAFLLAGRRPDFEVLGIGIVPTVRGEEVAGAYTLLEQTVPPGVGTPPHALQREDKVIYVVEGSFAIGIGDSIHPAVSGDRAVIPRGTDHYFRNAGNVSGKLLVVVSPAGHEVFLEALSRIGDDPGRVAALMEEHGVYVRAVPES